jgi:hypothetical protein
VGGWQRSRSPFDAETPFTLQQVDYAGIPTLLLATFDVPVQVAVSDVDPLITVNGSAVTVDFEPDTPLLQGLFLHAGTFGDPWEATAGTETIFTGPGGSTDLLASSGNIPELIGGVGHFTITNVYWINPTTFVMRFTNGVNRSGGNLPNLITVNGQAITLNTSTAANVLLATNTSVNVGDPWVVTAGASNTLTDSTSSSTMDAASGFVQ